MPSFRWSAISSSGEVVHGVSEAVDCTAVVERLQRQGQIVLRAEAASGRRSLSDLLQIELGTRRGLDRGTLVEITRELAIMLAAGQDLDFRSDNDARYGRSSRRGRCGGCATA